MIRRILRRLPDIADVLTSTLRLAWYRLLYPKLCVGKGVRIGKGATLRMTPSGAVTLGDGVYIDRDVTLIGEGRLVIGAHSYVGRGTIIASGERLEIGEGALIAAHVTIRDHDHGTASGTPYRLQKPVTSPVVIEDNVWIGANAVVVRGTRIGRDTIVGAGAVVTRDVPAGQLAVGVPARSRQRSEVSR